MKILILVFTFLALQTDVVHADPFRESGLPGWASGAGASSSGNWSALPNSFYTSIEENREPRAWIGVSLKPATLILNSESVPALEVMTVFPESPALSAGMEPGDRIVGLEGQSLVTGNNESPILNFLKQVAKAGVGSEVLLKVERRGRVFSTTARLAGRPSVPLPLDRSVSTNTPIQKGTPSLLNHLLKSSNREQEFSRTMTAMGRRADEVISTAVRGESFNPFQLNLVNSLLRRPLAFPDEAESRIRSLDTGLSNRGVAPGRLIESGARSLDLPLVSMDRGQSLPDSWTAYVKGLVNRIVELQERHRRVVADLDPKDIDLIEKWFLKWMRGLGKPERELTSEQKKKAETITLQVLNTAMKVDLQSLFQQAGELARAINLVHLKKLSETARRAVNIPEGWVAWDEGNRMVYQTPAGRVVVGGSGANVYRDEAVLILDLGGDDVYKNGAGSARPGRPFSIVIDLEGNDRYLSSQPFAQGSAFLGAGFLIDLKGSDTYSVGNLGQGTGIFGAGLLLDLEGRDRYICRAFCQAASAWGLGFLVDSDGYDVYQADMYAQAMGFVRGYSALVDEKGNDHYLAGGFEYDQRQPDKATKSMAQGFGLGLRPWESVAGASGGIGILYDKKGNDTYSADYFAQGASYWFALGILHDGGGHDRYLAGRYSQGAGVHFSLGILTDAQGDDEYNTHFGVSQGCGHDFGVGWLKDSAGNDLYSSGVMAQGAGNANGLGVLEDRGGQDRYIIEAEGQGRGTWETMRELASFGFLIDTGGGPDSYFPARVSNNHLFNNKDYGFLADVN